MRWEGCSGDAMLPRRRRPPEGWFSRRATTPEPEPAQVNSEQRAASLSEARHARPPLPVALLDCAGCEQVR